MLQPKPGSEFALLFWGVPFLIVLGISGMAFMQYRQFKSYVSPTPLIYTPVPKSSDAESKVMNRLHAFIDDSLETTLSLTGQDLTHLARTSASLAAQKKDYVFTLKDSLLIVQNSTPVSELTGIFMKTLRIFHNEGFVNSELTARADLQSDKFEWVPVKASMNGVAATLMVFQDRGRINVRNWVQDTTFYDAAFKAVKTLRISHDTLFLYR